LQSSLTPSDTASATSTPEEIPVSNGVAAPQPENGGRGIRRALDQYKFVFLREGVYEVDEKITLPGNRRIVGAGRRAAILKATAEIPYILGGPAGKYYRLNLEALHLDGNDLADNCLVQQQNNLYWNVSELRITDPVKDCLHIDSAFNSKYQSFRTQGGRHGCNVVSTTSVIASSLLFEKCDFGNTSHHAIAIGKQEYSSEDTRGATNIKLDHCDLSSSVIYDWNESDFPAAGLYLGKNAFNITVAQCDVEHNEIGIQIGREDLPSINPNKILIMGGKGSGNTTFLDVQSGRRISIMNLSESGSETSAKFRANAGGDIYELNNNWWHGVERETETVSPFGEVGTVSPTNRLTMREQDLRSSTSDRRNDVRMHDGSGDAPYGVYRGDGDGGWVKLSDNTITIE
jgi:hypothetical protein